jgi:peptidoglycan/xylan/chitin deacetylase (PgdA/CDA1 family)
VNAEIPHILANSESISTGESTTHVTYHAVLLHASDYLYQVSLAQLREHLEVLHGVAGRASADTPLPSISFDDGYRSDFEYAFPLLQACGFKATFFVLPGMIGTSTDCISWHQAKLMISGGHRIESHGWSHGMLTQYSAAALEREIVASKLEIEDRLGQAVTSLSAPGGRWDRRVVDLCARAGYKTLFHSNPWVPAREIDGVRVCGRLMVTRNMRGIDLLRFANAGSIDRLRQRAQFAAKRGIRMALGEDLYHALWCRLTKFRPNDGIELNTDLERSVSPE